MQASLLAFVALSYCTVPARGLGKYVLRQRSAAALSSSSSKNSSLENGAKNDFDNHSDSVLTNVQVETWIALAVLTGAMFALVVFQIWRQISRFKRNEQATTTTTRIWENACQDEQQDDERFDPQVLELLAGLGSSLDNSGVDSSKNVVVLNVKVLKCDGKCRNSECGSRTAVTSAEDNNNYTIKLGHHHNNSNNSFC